MLVFREMPETGVIGVILLRYLWFRKELQWTLVKGYIIWPIGSLHPRPVDLWLNWAIPAHSLFSYPSSGISSWINTSQFVVCLWSTFKDLKWLFWQFYSVLYLFWRWWCTAFFMLPLLKVKLSLWFKYVDKIGYVHLDNITITILCYYCGYTKVFFFLRCIFIWKIL